MWMKHLLLFVIGSGLAAKALQISLAKGRQLRLRREAQQQREAVQRWEHEGGNLKPR